MSPDMIVQFQRKMGECCESKVGHWKREIEKAKVASLLLNEVRVKQVGNHRDDVMHVNIDFSEETIRKYMISSSWLLSNSARSTLTVSRVNRISSQGRSFTGKKCLRMLY